MGLPNHLSVLYYFFTHLVRITTARYMCLYYAYVTVTKLTDRSTTETRFYAPVLLQFATSMYLPSKSKLQSRERGLWLWISSFCGAAKLIVRARRLGHQQLHTWLR